MIKCWDGHDEVSYEGNSGTPCPACMAIIEKQEEINTINKESKELKQAVRESKEEVDEFNLGYEDCMKGLELDDEPMDMPHDQWRVGWAWAWFNDNYERIMQKGESK